MGFIDGYTAVADAGQAGAFVGRASARRQGEVFSGDSVGSSKRLAQQAAAVSCIRALLGWPADVAGRSEPCERAGAPGRESGPDVERAHRLEPTVNAKGRLFEHCQAQRWAAPEFVITRSGQDHAPVFRCIATLVADGLRYEVIAEGADTRKEAESRACHLLLLKLEEAPVAQHDAQSTCLRLEHLHRQTRWALSRSGRRKTRHRCPRTRSCRPPATSLPN